MNQNGSNEFKTPHMRNNQMTTLELMDLNLECTPSTGTSSTHVINN